jgi:phage tail-like protein
MGGERATTSRRRFLGTAAGATGVALGAAALGGGRAAAAVAAPTPGPANQAPAAIGPRAYSAGHFALELGEELVGVLRDVGGGGIKADVIEFQSGTSGDMFKNLGAVHYEDLTLQTAFSLGKPLYDWIAASWNKNYTRKNGAIVAADFNYERKTRRQFTEALITEVSFPALDAASKDAGALTVTITPEQTQTKGDSGKLQAPTNAKQKQWTPANFRLELDGLDCSRVSKIDAFAVKQKIIEVQTGEDRIPHTEPGKLEFPNLTVTFAASSGQSWTSWFEDFVIKGNAGPDKEKTGKIVFLAPNMTDVLAEVHLFGVGIFKLDDGVFDPVNEPSAMMRAHLYVERMAFIWFTPGSGTTPTPTPPPNTG